MKVYPNKHPERKVSRYQQNLQEIAKISNYQPIPSIPAISEDFNFTFLAKDYDEANPYLNKNSMRRSGENNSKNQNQSLLLDQNLFDMPLFNTGSQVLLKKQTKKQKFKLPSINNQIHNMKQKSQISKKSIKGNDKQRQKQSQNLQQKQRQKIVKHNKSLTIATRLQTDDASILEDPSVSSLLKIETKSLSKSIEVEPVSRLKMSKITNPEIDMLRRHKDFLERQNLLSRNFSELSRFEDLSPVKSIEPLRIEEEESTGSESDSQYIKDSVPGPGSYSISHHTSFSKPSLGSSTISHSRSKNFTFGSRQSRFKAEKSSPQDYSSYLQKMQQMKQKQAERQYRMLRLYKREKKVVPFNCKQESNQSPQKVSFFESIISPMYYNPRDGIQEELIKKIQRNFKGGFGVIEKRFRTIYKKNPNVGPGSYSVNMAEQDEDEAKRQAHYFLSKKNRFQ